MKLQAGLRAAPPDPESETAQDGPEREAMLQAEEAPKHGAPIRETPKRGAGRREATQWLIVKDGGNGRLEPVCVDGGGRRVLPVFCFREEAEMFIHLGGHGGDGWRARGTSADELVSVLHGPCADAGSVALDPLPEMLDDGMARLVEVGRKRFLERLAAEHSSILQGSI